MKPWWEESMTAAEIVLTLSGVVTFLAGAIVLYLAKSSLRKMTVYLFFSITTCLALWIFTNSFFTIVPEPIAYIFVFASYGFGMGALVSALLLSESIAGINSSTIVKRLALGVLIASVSVIPGVIAVDMTSDRSIVSSHYAIYFIIVLIIFSGYSIGQTLKHIRNQPGIVKHDLGLVVAGFIAAITIGVVCNLAIPIIFDSYTYTKLGPIGSLIFVGVSGYIILKARYIDLRYVVIRGIIYTILTLSVFILITIVTSYVIDLILARHENRVFSVSLISCIILILGLSVQPIKNRIDKVSNKVFFQQNYSVHETINAISSYAANNIDAGKIQKNTLRIIDSTINPQYGLFILFTKDKKLSTRSSSGNINEKLTDDAFLEHVIKRHTKIMTETSVAKDTVLRTAFDVLDIGTITKLTTYNKTIGYLVLGKKKSGKQYNGHDLRLLELTANDLALAIENAQRHEEIQAFNKTLQYKINQATKALKRTNEKLVALDDAKDEFISMASHQLRTPLTSIKGYISMMLEGDLGRINATQRRALEEAFDSSQRMVFLISDFLNVSRIRTGRFIIESRQTDLAQIVIEEIQQLRDMAALRNQEIIYTPPTKFPIVALDENKIRQVMMNMLDNAIYYTPKEGQITIRLEHSSNEIKYTVTDNGIGVPAKEQHRLFTKFFRAGNARKARPDGTGLGLFMAQKVISAQGGSIVFKSKEGEGSTFGFRFPLSKIKIPVDKNNSNHL